MYYNHRLVVHRNSVVYTAEYTTVRETFYDDLDRPESFSLVESSPQTKGEAEMIMKAFDKPPVAWVDDSSMTVDADGFVSYTKWGWL